LSGPRLFEQSLLGWGQADFYCMDPLLLAFILSNSSALSCSALYFIVTPERRSWTCALDVHFPLQIGFVERRRRPSTRRRARVSPTRTANARVAATTASAPATINSMRVVYRIPPLCGALHAINHLARQSVLHQVVAQRLTKRERTYGPSA